MQRIKPQILVYRILTARVLGVPRRCAAAIRQYFKCGLDRSDCRGRFQKDPRRSASQIRTYFSYAAQYPVTFLYPLVCGYAFGFLITSLNTL